MPNEITPQKQKRHLQTHQVSNKRLKRSVFTTMSIPANVSDEREKSEGYMMPGLGKNLYGFPNSLITKLRYCDVITMTNTGGALSVYVFAANGIYDPDLSSVGHQPMWRDTFATIYDQYIVLGSKITATFTPSGATTTPTIVGIIGDDDASNSNGITTLMESNNSVSRVVANSGAGVPETLTMTFSPDEMFGIQARDDGSSRTSQGANPGELWCYILYTRACDLTTANTMAVRVEIEYTVRFSELSTISAS